MFALRWSLVMLLMVAFIIGDGGYPKSLALKNPLNDATAIEKQLSNLGHVALRT